MFRILKMHTISPDIRPHYLPTDSADDPKVSIVPGRILVLYYLPVNFTTALTRWHLALEL